MKKLLLLFLLTMTACGRFTAKNPEGEVVVVKNEPRVLLSTQHVVTVRPNSGSSPSFASSLPSFENIASVLAPSSGSSTNDVQATSVVLKDNYAYISYNMQGNEVYGAIDIINISNPNNPTIEYTYSTEELEFSDLRVKGNYLLLAGYRKETSQHSAGAILTIIDITSKSSPIIKKVVSVPGIYATSMDLLDNKVLVNTGTTGGLHKYDISDPENPTLISSVSKSNGLYAKTGNLFDYSLSGSSNSLLELTGQQTGISNSSLVIAQQASEAPSRFTRQNALIYLNNTRSGKLHVIDISQGLKGITSELSSLSVLGTANGIAHDQQILFLAQGEKGVAIIDVANPSAPINLGKFDFNEDSGSANNLWIEKNNVGKFFFLADGRQGLRILKETNTPSPTSAIISFYARSMDYNGSAVVSVRVNGQEVSTVQISGTQFSLYNVTYSRALTATDTVDVVFINDDYGGIPASDKNAMIAYLKVNGNYCYIDTVASGDNLGLYQSNQALSITGENCQTKTITLLCSPNSEKVPTELCTLPNNHQGKLTCDSTGTSYICVDSGNCGSGFVLVNNQCVPVICQANTEKQDCSDSTSVREKTCNSNGTGFGSCNFISCKPNYIEENGQCVPQVCSPNSTTSCSVNNGSGSKTCNSSGSAYGTCQTTSCNAGYYLSNGQCLPQSCVPNSTESCVFLNAIGTKTCNSEGSSYGVCITGTTCVSGYHMSLGLCIPNTCEPNSVSSCPISNGTGTKSCDNIGSGYGSCVVTSCNAGFYQSGNQCLPQACSPNSTQSCVNNHLVGTQTCNANGSTYGSCVTGNTCEVGYYFDNGQCLTQTCSPNSTTSCSAMNGTGTKTCNSNGSDYGSCVINQCNVGYYLSGGTCVAQSCIPLSTQACVNNHLVGIQTCNAQGSSYGSCVTGIICETGYYYSNGQCLPQSCSPNYVVNCSENNGTGTKVCNLQGSGYGNCSISQCNAGFYLENGACIAQTCSPNSTTSCSVPNGSGTKTCNSQGSAYGTCVLTTCNVGYYNNSGTCVAQTCTPNSTQSCLTNHFTGTQTCNAQGSAYGACVSSGTCESGYYLNNGQCLPQECSPNSTTSCSVLNGTGTKTCNASGSAYGACTATSCNSGFYNANGLCLPQLCVPLSTQVCVDNHLIGVQTCSVNGSGLGLCIVTGTNCESGYYYNNGQCLPQVCSPNSNATCSVTNGTGNKICNAQGSAYGACSVNSCNSGYTLVNGQCVAQVCSPNTTSSCSVSNGTGSQTCNSNGTAYGSCTTTSCNSGYHLENGACVVDNVCSVTNGTGSLSTINNAGYAVTHDVTSDWGNGYGYQLRVENNSGSDLNDWSVCFNFNYNVNGVSNSDINSASSKPNWKFDPKPYNKIIYNGSNVTMNWTATPGNLGSNRLQNVVLYNSSSPICSGTPVWASGPVCLATSCNAGYHIENNMCVSNTRSCTVPGGTGTQTWSNGQWGACTNVVCTNSNHALISVNVSGRTHECSASCPLGLLKVNIGGIYLCL